MGLAEKRWVQERKTNDEAALITQIKAIAQTEVAVEIDWESFANSIADAEYIASDSYGLPNLVKALKEITVDDLGKDAIKGGLKKIVVTAAPAEKVAFTFSQGVVTWKAYFGSSSSGYIYADAMKKAIEAEL